MMRTSASGMLDVYANGILVGFWERRRGVELFRYAPEWVANPLGRPISMSMPFNPANDAFRGEVVTNYFDNLLPDSRDIRERLAAKYRTHSTNSFSLLSEIGRDCVGALQIMPHEEKPAGFDKIAGRTLNEDEIAQLLSGVIRENADADDDDFRISIAGAQEKTALLWHKDQWHVPLGATPTTHLFKLPMGLVGGNARIDLSESVENEWLCAQICEAFDLPVARCNIAQFPGQKVLIVDRFDRAINENGKWIMRLPQEDMCQAFGVAGHLKYQSNGGPGIEQIMSLLQGSENVEQDRRIFYKSQIVFWLMAAIDGHAKNFSIALLSGGRYQLTPLYDILSAHPYYGNGPNRINWRKSKMAMAVKGKSNHYGIASIQRRHWVEMAKQVGMAHEAELLLEEVADKTADAISHAETLLPANFPEELAQRIFDGMRNQRELLVKQK